MKRISGINFLRFIAAIGIIVYHFGCHNPIAESLLYISPFANIGRGDLWVTIFLIISGMCLARKYKDIEAFDIKQFWVNRWKSIFPMFFLIYVCTFIYRATQVNCFWWNPAADKLSLLLTFLGIDGYLMIITQIPCYFLVGEWFLGALILLYIFFPLLLVLAKKIPAMSLAFFTLFAWWLPFVIASTYVPQHISTIILSFFIGICLERVEHLLNNKIVVIGAWVGVLCISFIPMSWMTTLRYPAVIYRVVVFFVALKSLGTWIEHFNISGKVIAKLAALSYPMFLLQHVVIVEVLRLIPEPQSTWMAALLLLLDIVLTIAFAWLFSFILPIIQTQIQKLAGYFKRIHITIDNNNELTQH